MHATPPDTPELWMDHMLKGKFEEAWKCSDAVLAARSGKPCWHLPRHMQYIWDGSPCAGKRVLVRCYHGLGDTIQFIRYIPLLKAAAAEVIVWAQPSLLPLLETVTGIDQLLPLHNSALDILYDMDVEIMELPHLFRSTLSTLPSAIPYLHADPAHLPPAQDQLTVGLVWKAGEWDERRSVPFSELGSLIAIPGLRFYILQAGASAAGWMKGSGIYPGEFELYEYARMVKAMDLLITVDSMPAHLAGALGVPVWTLLHNQADWRWMESRDDSPWYPTMRLFRQEHPGEWAPVIRRVEAALRGSSETGSVRYD